MDQSPDKSAYPSVWMHTAASLALGLCLFAGQGLRISRSVVDFLAANSERHFANSSPSECAVASHEKQIRTHGKTARRLVQFGALPPNNGLDIPAVCGERSLAEVRWQTLTTRLLTNDRAPPTLTA